MWKNLKTPRSVGVVGHALHPCPNSPNCVSTSAKDQEHEIKPFVYSDDTLSQIESFFKKHYIARVVKKTPNYLYIVVTTKIFRFKDDVEFLAKPERGIVEVRSASRVGYSDMGVNRSRIEHLRAYLKQTDCAQ